MLDSLAAVVVTGGSSGIGKSFIEHMGRLRPKLLFCNLSRREPGGEFTRAGNELNLRHVPCDLEDSAALAAAAATVLDSLNREAPPGPMLLINNAGYGGYGRFPEPSREHQLGMIDLNIRAVVDLTARLQPVLRQRGGGIVNIASTAAFQPTAFLSTYGATKAFILHWSLGLAEELRGSNLQVLAVCPGPTRTDFFRRAGVRAGTVPEALGQSSAQVVQEALAALGRGRAVVVTGWKNKLLAAASGSLPRHWSARLGARVLERVRLRQVSAR